MAKTLTEESASYEPAESPYQDSEPVTSVVAFDAAFAARLARRQMLGTYKRYIDFDYGEFEIKGVVYNTVKRTGTMTTIDTDTGEEIKEEKDLGIYHQLIVKRTDNVCMMAAGKAADRAWNEEFTDLGFPPDMGDFPEGQTLRIKVASQTLKGKTKDGEMKKWPVITLV